MTWYEKAATTMVKVNEHIGNTVSLLACVFMILEIFVRKICMNVLLFYQ